MQELSPIESSAFKSLKKVITWFIVLRWIACIGVSLVLIFSYFLFSFQLQYKVLTITTVILVLMNFLYSYYFYNYKKQYLQRREIHLFFQIQIIGDYILLLVLVFFSGFMENPLIFFFVFHIIITSFLFTSRIVALYTTGLVLLIGSISLFQYFQILPVFPLFANFGSIAAEVRLVQTAGFSFLLIITAYLTTSIINKIDARNFTTKEFSVRKIISENISNITTRAAQEDVHLSVACPRHLKITTNRDLINIILGNLLFNAIKYTEAGGNVSLIASEKGHEIHLVVEDTGIGICDDEIEKVFDEFYRSRRARVLEKDGTGLGLSIVQKAVNALKGRIIVYSTEGKGSSFHVFLPAYIDTGKIPGGENAANTNN